MSNPELITAVDLDQWSGTLAAPTTLPILVRRLILATTSVTEITMGAREGALLPGWDGIVRCDVMDAHVPLGISGWELGTSKDPRHKAQSDIRSRTRDPLGLDPTTTTFVAVTSRSWRDRDDWLTAQRKQAKWADVRAYDAGDLVTWLERAPSVHRWISEQLGREPRDVGTLDGARGQKVAGHVFISYVREDSGPVDQLQRTLEAARIPVWRDTADLWPGEDWRARIRAALVMLAEIGDITRFGSARKLASWAGLTPPPKCKRPTLTPYRGLAGKGVSVNGNPSRQRASPG